MKQAKRPIDAIRDGACSFKVRTPDDDSAITGMITLKDRLLIIKECGIYETKLADQIDPERKNINTPNTLQQVLAYGSKDDWVAKTFLTGDSLLKDNMLKKHIDTKEAMLLVLEITKNIAGAQEVYESVTKTQDTELNKCDMKIKDNRSLMLPSMLGIENKIKEFFQKSDHALDSLFKIVKLFYPDINSGGWDRLKQKIDEDEAIDNFKDVLEHMLPFLHLIRNGRNCVEHPRDDQKIVACDFSVDAENKLLPPTIEIIHAKSKQSPIPVANFMQQASGRLVNTIELMLVFLCNRQINREQGIPVEVYQIPEKQRRTKNVRYGYGVSFKGSIVPYG